MKLSFGVWFLAATLVAVAAIFPLSLSGQAISGDLVGSVVDVTGAAIAGATVTAQNEETIVKTVTKSEDTGIYHFRNLPVGSYSLTASAPGFTSSSLKDVQVQLSATLTQNFTLTVGSTSTTVEVSEAAVALDTTTAQLQSTY